MSTTYTPDGLTPPVPSITLPQDVIDPVVVATVNPPFQNLADNIAWQLLAARNVVSAANYGVNEASSAVANTTGMQAAIAALVAVGGGTILLPEGHIVVNAGALDRPSGVHLMGVPGETVLSLDDATANFNVLSDLPAGKKSICYGVDFEGEQANTGRLFHVPTSSSGTSGELLIVQCSCNTEDSNLTGQLYNVPVAQVTQIQSRMLSQQTSVLAGEPIAALGFQAFGGELAMAGVAPSNLIFAAEYLLMGVLLSRIATSGSFSFGGLSSGGSGRIVGCRTAISGGLTFLADIVTNTLIQASGNDLRGLAVLYNYVSGPLLNGSDLQLTPELSHFVGSGTTYTIPDAVRAAALSFSAASPPGITLPTIMQFGQMCSVAVYNDHGSGTWGADFIVFLAQGADVVRYDAVGLDNVTDGQFVTINFVAVLDPVTNLKTWTQSGAHTGAI